MTEQKTPGAKPMSDSQIEAIMVGGAERPDGRIEISDYDARWPEQFAEQAKRIRSALGDVALAVEHGGSTSVPGLAAKPVLDIILTVADSANETSYAARLEAAGFALRVREPDWFEHRMFKGPDPAVNLHVFSQGCPEIARMKLLRDWLRASPADRMLYEETKRKLSANDWSYVQNYADAKTEVIAQIMERASAWAAKQNRLEG